MKSGNQTSYRIRAVKLADSQLIQRYLWTHLRFEQVIERLKRVQHLTNQERGGGIVVMNTGGTPPIVAYGQLTRWTQCAEISDLIVLETHRRQGIGTMMIRYLMDMGRNMGLSCAEIGVAESNLLALSLYRRLGFEDSYTVQANLGNGEETVIYLRKTIS